ncbi:FGGY-family carbohydrate kinase [Acaryochloris sp. IP29b_bin.137]|uniref:FGGY-family carbohydrate kinase n=1 Tax=Acaryochloris sp. IP29b_bin.137 TaxID=2969217 RepID=UPI002617A31D|nr:FGGY-family carbohydrate kinase [Acaryochloris sp. IP29b_bin.137]
MNYSLGIDFGTSGARAIVIDQHDSVLAEESCALSEMSPAERTGHWQNTLWELIGGISADVRSHLKAIAINGTSSTILLCSADGTPLYPPQMYNDTCDPASLELLATLAPAGHPVLSASSSLAKLLGMSRSVDMAPVRYLMHQADWLAGLLHGRWGLSDEHNSLKLGYDPAMTVACCPKDIGRSSSIAAYPDWFQQPPLNQLLPLLPQVLKPGSRIATIQAHLVDRFGIPSECQICAGTTDSIAAFIASGADQPGMAVTSLGSTLVLKLLSPTRIDQADYGIYSHRFGNYWLVGGASNTGGAVLQSFFSTAELVELSQQIDPSQPSPLNYYPLLKPGERFPLNDPHMQPRLTPRPEDPAEFLQGLLESLARIEAQGYHLLQAHGAPSLQTVYTAGGGAQNSVWQTIRQRHLQVPVYAAQHQQAAYGSARLAAQGSPL